MLLAKFLTEITKIQILTATKPISLLKQQSFPVIRSALLLFMYQQICTGMVGFSALIGLMSGTKTCSNGDLNQKLTLIFMCVCQPAFSPQAGGIQSSASASGNQKACSPTSLITAGCVTGFSHSTLSRVPSSKGNTD